MDSCGSRRARSKAWFKARLSAAAGTCTPQRAGASRFSEGRASLPSCRATTPDASRNRAGAQISCIAERPHLAAAIASYGAAPVWSSSAKGSANGRATALSDGIASARKSQENPGETADARMRPPTISPPVAQAVEASALCAPLEPISPVVARPPDRQPGEVRDAGS